MQYFTPKGDKLVCLLCGHYCSLSNGQKGICGVNQNIGGVIKNLVYGYPSALHVDPVEKKPLYHFLPSSKTFSLGTIGCNFKCPFCQNWGLSQEKMLPDLDYFSPERIVNLALQNECKSIAFTYNEPTIFYPYAKDIALLAHQKGLKTIYVTNGFESPEVIDDMKGVIDALNVDLKSFNAEYYKKSLGGNLAAILENLKHFKRNGIWMEITTLIVPTKNDGDDELRAMATFIAHELGVTTPWHLSAFHPDFKETKLPKTSVQTMQRAYAIAKEAGLKHVYIGNTNITNDTHCTACNTLLLQRSHFSVVSNNLKNGRCPQCNHTLEGVYDES